MALRLPREGPVIPNHRHIMMLCLLQDEARIVNGFTPLVESTILQSVDNRAGIREYDVVVTPIHWHAVALALTVLSGQPERGREHDQTKKDSRHRSLQTTRA